MCTVDSQNRNVIKVRKYAINQIGHHFYLTFFLVPVFKIIDIFQELPCLTSFDFIKIT